MLLKSLKFISLFLVMASMALIPASALGLTNYVLDTDGKTQISIPVCYESTGFYSVLGDASVLSEPSDLFADTENNLYIADTGNNRIVKLDPTGKFLKEYTHGGKLSAPRGIYVEKNGDLFISDSGNERILHIKPDGTFVEEFTRPESEMLDKDMDFSVNRIRISNQGYLMVIKGTKFMSIDADNEFKGYVGSNTLGFSLKRLFVRMFASDEQKAKLRKDEPVAYNSFDISDDGMIYAVTAEDEKTNQIRKINAVGENIYPAGFYGETYYNEQIKAYNTPRFGSISVSKDNIVFVLEQYSGRIYAYDQEGTLLCAFGGMGNVKGTFVTPVAIDTDSAGRVYVLDSSTGYVHVFSPTEFINHVYEASNLYGKGEYEEACEAWEKVLELDVNYSVANLGYSRCLYKLGDDERAQHYAELAEDKSVYSNAFSEARYKIFQNNFTLVVICIAVALAILIFAVIVIRRYAKRWRESYYDRRMAGK